MAGQWHNATFSIGTDFGHRFLGKLALGMGALFLDPTFQQSDDARKLRDFMWEKDPDARASIQIAGTTFLAQKLKPIAQLLGWPAGHILLFLPIDGQLLLCPIFYGEQSAAIIISTNPSFWQGRIDDDGTLFVVAPGLRQYVGPISVAEYLEVKLNNSIDPVALVELFRSVSAIQPLPPYD